MLCSVAGKLVVCAHLSTRHIKCIASRSDNNTASSILSFRYDVVCHIRCAATTTSENSRETATAIIVKATERRNVMRGVVVGGPRCTVRYCTRWQSVACKMSVNTWQSLCVYTLNGALYRPIMHIRDDNWTRNVTGVMPGRKSVAQLLCVHRKHALCLLDREFLLRPPTDNVWLIRLHYYEVLKIYIATVVHCGINCTCEWLYKNDRHWTASVANRTTLSIPLCPECNAAGRPTADLIFLNGMYTSRNSRIT